MCFSISVYSALRHENNVHHALEYPFESCESWENKDNGPSGAFWREIDTYQFATKELAWQKGVNGTKNCQELAKARFCSRSSRSSHLWSGRSLLCLPNFTEIGENCSCQDPKCNFFIHVHDLEHFIECKVELVAKANTYCCSQRIQVSRNNAAVSLGFLSIFIHIVPFLKGP